MTSALASWMRPSSVPATGALAGPPGVRAALTIAGTLAAADGPATPEALTAGADGDAAAATGAGVGVASAGGVTAGGATAPGALAARAGAGASAARAIGRAAPKATTAISVQLRVLN